MDKGNPKRANGEVTRGKEGDIPLEWLGQTRREREKVEGIEREKKKKEKKKKKEREREEEIEAPHSL